MFAESGTLLCKKWNKTDEAEGAEKHGISQLYKPEQKQPPLQRLSGSCFGSFVALLKPWE